MEAEKVFCKDMSLFSKDNKSNGQTQSQFKTKVSKNMNKVINKYNIEEKEVRRDTRGRYKDQSDGLNNEKNRDYSFRKLSEPLLVMMLNCFIEKNSKKENKQKLLLNKYIHHKDYALNQIANLPKDVIMKIKDSAIYEYDYELSKFLELFFEKIDEILNLIIVPNVFLDEISGNILSNLNDIINSIKATVATHDIKKIPIDTINMYFKKFKDKGIPDEITQPYKDYLYSEIQKTNLYKLYNNFDKYNNLDKLVKEEFLRLNNLTEKIYIQFQEDKKLNPNSIFVENSKEPLIDYSGHYKLDKFSTRSDLLFILKTSDLTNELLSSLEPQTASKENIESLLNETSIRKYSLKNFISIYKQEAYDKFKIFLDQNKYCTKVQIYSEYERITEDLCKNIKLAENATANKIYLANKSVGKPVFDRAKNIIDTIYKYILDPQTLDINLENYELTLNMLESLKDLITNKVIPKKFKISDSSLTILYNLIISNTINKDLLPNDVLKLLEQLLIYERILNPNLKSITVTSDSLALMSLLNNKYIEKIKIDYRNNKINKIDVYLLILSNKNIIDNILNLINLKDLQIIYSNQEVFNLYDKVEIDLNKIFHKDLGYPMSFLTSNNNFQYDFYDFCKIKHLSTKFKKPSYYSQLIQPI